MAPKKSKTSKPRKTSKRNASKSGTSNDEYYRKKREQNNQAVKRSRVKAKQQFSQTKDRVDKLKKDNEKLQERIMQKQKNMENMKSLFLETVKAKSETPTSVSCELQKLLADSDNEDDEQPEPINRGRKPQSKAPK